MHLLFSRYKLVIKEKIIQIKKSKTFLLYVNVHKPSGSTQKLFLKDHKFWNLKDKNLFQEDRKKGKSILDTKQEKGKIFYTTR